MEYELTAKDFKKAFEFGIEYYLDPTKNQSGRTSAEPRGFGGTLDAFTAGKLVEIGVSKMIESLAKGKKIGLDFDMKSVQEVRTEPDIINVIDEQTKRTPNLFIEIKRTQIKDRWIGPFQEQLNSIEEGSEGRKIYFIYASLESPIINDNYKSADVVGMYLKHSTNLDIFKNFSPLNSKVKLEFIFSTDDLKNHGTEFPAGENFYETDLFPIKKIKKSDGSLSAGINKIKSYNNYSDKIHVPLKNGKKDNKYGTFNITGSFDILEKKYPKSTRQIIYCHSDVKLSNNVFGEYIFSKNCSYNFNLETVGRDPKLKRNNLFLAKRRISTLIDKKILSNPIDSLELISKSI